MATFLKSFAGRRVFVTGHTGFKGSWLSEWLLGLGARVSGFSLPPATRPALFRQLGLADRLDHTEGDLRDAGALQRALVAARPHCVFHLAAQPIVRTAHGDPAETWAVNVMGTVNLLEALRRLKHPCSAVIITTDKVYAASTDPRAEDHAVGATEPYGGSKAAVELAVAAWRQAYFPMPMARSGRGFPTVALATARSGNVIAGGDWAKRSAASQTASAPCAKGVPDSPCAIPSAVRPWQHVLRFRSPATSRWLRSSRGALVSRSDSSAGRALRRLQLRASSVRVTIRQVRHVGGPDPEGLAGNVAPGPRTRRSRRDLLSSGSTRARRTGCSAGGRSWRLRKGRV
jgi:nucleoside-diphosphate-sugar epimerase